MIQSNVLESLGAKSSYVSTHLSFRKYHHFLKPKLLLYVSCH